MLNDDEIVTSVQEESDPVNDETDEDEDNSSNESSMGPSNADAFSALATIRKLPCSTTAAQENQRPCSEKTKVYNGTAKNEAPEELQLELIDLKSDHSMKKMFNGTRRKGRSISEIVRQLGISRSTVSRVYQEYMDGGQKTSDRANCKGQLALTVRGDRRLRRIVRSQ
ncbi:uncharacterized protein TNCV_5064141 [Trichonephila clavipes]|nr:uncharacterized protein TNCV_5064141 [Trichonephila clavipes]